VTPPRDDLELDCTAAEAFVEAYVDGELTPDEASRLRRHLERCPTCAAEIGLATTIRDGLRALPELDPPAAVLARVRELANEPAAQKVVPFSPPTAARAPRRRWVVAATLAAMLVAVVGVRLATRPSAPPQASAAEVQDATRQARFALAYIGRMSRHASETVRDEVIEQRVLLPATMSVARPLDPQWSPAPDRRTPKGT
jgi:anti-sigma factor (TIGR02949 family)